MFTNTEAAAQLIKGQMEAEGEGEMYLRVFTRPGGGRHAIRHVQRKLMVGVTGFTGVCCGIMLKYGGVSEWFMEMVLKTIDRKVRGFESLPLRRRRLSDRYDPVGT